MISWAAGTWLFGDNDCVVKAKCGYVRQHTAPLNLVHDPAVVVLKVNTPIRTEFIFDCAVAGFDQCD